MKPGNRLACAAAVACLAWAIVMPAVTVAQATPQKVAADYLIGPNDVLDIRVFNQDKLTNKYSVASDGSFTFPMVGRVPAGGLTARAVEDYIRDSLAKTSFRDPQVTVVVDQFRSQQVYVLGQVRSPQTLQFTGSLTLVDALARVGGPTDRAGSEVLIAKPSSTGAPAVAPTGTNGTANQPSASDPNVIRVNLEALQRGDFSQNIPLMSGYIVGIPAAETAFVQGQVARPSEYPIRPGMTVQQLLTLAGGMTDLGSDRRIEIQRVVNGKKTTIKAKLDDPVQGKDIIIVPKRWL